MTFILTILGSNSALPTSKRFSTAQVLNIHERFFLIDCGEGTQIQLRKFKIKLSKINHIFISHLHGDHYFGIFGLISSFGLLGRTTDLHIHCPPQLEDIVNCILKHHEDRIFNIIFHPFKSKNTERIYEDKHITVDTIPLIHRVPTWGFLFKEKPKERNIHKEAIEVYKIPIRAISNIKKGADFITEDGREIKNQLLTIPPFKSRSYAFCSDTAYNEQIIEQIKDVDLLYHETTYLETHRSIAEITTHSTTLDAARIALQANAKKLLIGHFSARNKEISEMVDETRTLFNPTEAAEDGCVFSIQSERENK